MTVTILALGTRGATPLFAAKTLALLNSADFACSLISSETLGIKKITKHGLGADLLKVFGFWSKYKTTSKAIKEIRIKKTSVIIFLFPHPLDLAIKKRLEKTDKHIRYIRIAHEAFKHPGDKWPSTAWHIKSRKVDAIVTLSEFVSMQITESKPPIYIGAHPSFPIITPPRIFSNIKFDSNYKYDLIIGRHRKYQDLRGAIKLWIEDKSGREEMRLVVAGRFSWFVEIIYKSNVKVDFIKGNITDEMFQNLVSRAESVYCLYKEASQSGVVAMCQSLNTRVIVSEVGGLPEQIKKYGGGVLVSSPSSTRIYTTKYLKSAKTDLMDKDFLSALTSAITFCHKI